MHNCYHKPECPTHINTNTKEHITGSADKKEHDNNTMFTWGGVKFASPVHRSSKEPMRVEQARGVKFASPDGASPCRSSRKLILVAFAALIALTALTAFIALIAVWSRPIDWFFNKSHSSCSAWLGVILMEETLTGDLTWLDWRLDWRDLGMLG